MPQSARRLSPRTSSPKPASRPDKKPPARAKRPRKHLVVDDDDDKTVTQPSTGGGGRASNTNGGEWYAVKDILDEKVEKGVRHYYIDWEDNPETGEKYPHSWELAKNVNKEAVRDWKAKKQQKAGELKKTQKDSQSDSYVDSNHSADTSQSAGFSQTAAAAVTRKRSFSHSDDSTAPGVTPPLKRLRRSRLQQRAKRNHPALLSSPPSSRESTESSDLGLDRDVGAIQAITVELNPGSQFDPDEYIRFSQLASQSQNWPQSSPAQNTSAAATAELERPQSPARPADAVFQESPRQVSGPTIPDSQGDSTGQLEATSITGAPESLDASEGSKASESVPEGTGTTPQGPEPEGTAILNPGEAGSANDQACLPSVLPEIPSHQPENNASEGQEAAPAADLDDSLRESRDWASEAAFRPRDSQSALPWESSQESAQESAQLEGFQDHDKEKDTSAQNSASANSSEPILFLTQLEPDFDLSSQVDPRRAVIYTSVSPGLSSGSLSVIPDSARPNRIPTAAVLEAPSSAQIVQQLHSGEELVFTEQSVLNSQILPQSEDEGPEAPGVSTGYSSPCSASRIPEQVPVQGSIEKPEGLESLPKQITSSQQLLEDYNMDGEHSSSAVDLLKQAQREALGPEGLSSIDDPLVLAEIQRLEHEGQSSRPQEAASSASAEPPFPLVSAAASIPAAELLVPITENPGLSRDGFGLISEPLALAHDAPEVMGAPLLTASQTVPHNENSAIETGMLAANSNDNNVSTLPQLGDHLTTEVEGDVPGTIAPSALSFTAPVSSASLELSPEPEHIPVGLAVEPEDTESSPLPEGDSDVAGSPIPIGEVDGSELPQPPSNPNFTTREYVVTLPLAANSRQRYIDLVMDKKNQKTIKEFGDVFSRDMAEMPSAEVVYRVDELLRKLLDLSDLPPFYDSLPSMSNEAMMKHAVNTNSKFSFVYELLDSISTLNKKVLILARSGVALDYLQAILTYADIPVQRLTEAKAPEGEKASSSSGLLFVILMDTEASPANLPSDIDIAIGFDHTARTSGLITRYLDASTSEGNGDSHGPEHCLPKPVVLFLVAAYTLEHVDLRLELQTVDDLERKNALFLCTLECLSYIQDTAFDDVPSKPHDAAEAFSKMFHDPGEALEWKPTPLPEDAFDIYMHSSGGLRPTFSQEEGLGESILKSRKRQLDDDAHGEDAPKRARLNEATTPIVPDQPIKLSDTITEALGGHLLVSGPAVQISLTQLEALAAKTTALEAQLQEKESLETALADRVRSLDKLVKASTATINECQRKLMETTKDRGIFEVDRDKAIKEAEAAKEKLDSRDATIAELKEQKAVLEKRVAEADELLKGSGQPNLAVLAEARAEAQEAQRKVAALERKATNAETDLAHARRAYQDASNAAADLSAENRDLAARIKELDLLAADNLRHIHDTHQRNEAEAYRRQWEELQTMLKERERDLEWTREELRVLKNGRRETRQQSVPRSPRLGVMSPRTIAGRGGSAAAAGLGSGVGSGIAGGGTPIAGTAWSSVSRGNSPVSANFDPASYGQSIGGGVAGAGGAGGAPVPGMAYFNPQQGGGRWGHLRD